MGFRFRKSINLGGGFRINISKSGIGYSWGVKGYRVTKTAKGTTRRTASIPGTGISYVSETGKRKNNSKPRPNPTPAPHSQTIDNNHYDTREITNSVATDMVSDGLKNILKRARRTIRLNNLSTFGMILFFFLGFVNELFIFAWLAFIALKIYAITGGRIKLEYVIDDDQKEAVDQRMKPMLKVTESERVWRITQTSKVIDKKYASGASNSVQRVLCKTSKKPPYPFKSNVPAATFKSGKETLIFLPDKLFIKQKRKLGALNYHDIITNSHTTRFIEDGPVPKDARVVGRTWKYVNKTGGPDKRFRDNRELPICQYGEIELMSASGLNTVLMFSNASLQ